MCVCVGRHCIYVDEPVLCCIVLYCAEAVLYYIALCCTYLLRDVVNNIVRISDIKGMRCVRRDVTVTDDITRTSSGKAQELS